MNFALSTGAASAFDVGAMGAVAGGLACASAPETISVLTAADIIRVFNMCASKASLFSQGKRSFLTHKQLASAVRVPRNLELGRKRGEDLRIAARSTVAKPL